MRIARTLLVAATAASAVLALAACGPEAPTPDPTAAPTASGSAAPTPTAGPAELVADGTAADNLPYFQLLIENLVAQKPDAKGRDLVDALVAGGFDKGAMEVTKDKTAVNLDADSIEFSVRWSDACLVGSYGGGEFTSAVLPILATGKCLVGNTRTIDW